MAEHPVRQLHHISRRLRELTESIGRHIEEGNFDMLVLDFSALTALGAQLEAFGAGLDATISGDVAAAQAAAAAAQQATDQADAQAQISAAASSLSSQQSTVIANATQSTVVSTSLSGGVSSSLGGTSLSQLSAPSTGVSTSLAPPIGVSVSPTSVSGPVGGPISQQLSASGGSAPYTFAVDTAAPPPPADVTLAADGTLSIGGQTAETGSISVIATDSLGEASPSTVVSISVA